MPISGTARATRRRFLRHLLLVGALPTAGSLLAACTAASLPVESPTVPAAAWLV